MTFGSLFSGIGGMDLGLERAGMTCKWQVEIDEYCRRVLAKHWPNVRRWDDVRTFPPDGDWGVDFICGGDPCQANSAAGISTKQSLGGEFIRVVDALRPRIVLRENPAHIRLDAPWPWWRFRASMESIGYACLPFRLRACCLGAQHRRERLFLLAENANANRNRLEGWTRQTSEMEAMESAGLVEKQDFPTIPADPGFNSRAGLSTYVDECRALGNAVVPQVSQWLGERILQYDQAVQRVR